MMMDTPLLLTGFLERARRYYPNKMMISRTSETKWSTVLSMYICRAYKTFSGCFNEYRNDKR